MARGFAVAALTSWVLDLVAWLWVSVPVRAGLIDHWSIRSQGIPLLCGQALANVGFAALLFSLVNVRVRFSKLKSAALITPLMLIWGFEIFAFAASVFDGYMKWEYWFNLTALCTGIATLTMGIVSLSWCRSSRPFVARATAASTASIRRSARGLRSYRRALFAFWCAATAAVLATTVAQLSGRSGAVTPEVIIGIALLAAMWFAGSMVLGLHRYTMLPAAAGGQGLAIAAFAVTFGASAMGCEAAIAQIARWVMSSSPRRSFLTDITPLEWAAHLAAAAGALLLLVSLSRTARAVDERMVHGKIIAALALLAEGAAIALHWVPLTNAETVVAGGGIFIAVNAAVVLMGQWVRRIERALEARAPATAF